MVTTPNLLARFNEQVLTYQGEAYTLASYALGTDEGTDAAVQQAFLKTYRRYTSHPDRPIRLAVLSKLVRLCGRTAQRRNGSRSVAPEVLCPACSPRERCALLLVDVLHLSYEQTKNVLSCSKPQLIRWVARARERMERP